ncbi:MAG TPA: TauD/TfdA family dioxygenase, partial [Patescibacteria group bacterium]|nr:TauD/TfdA family dioxygenase [Patescibacteria group bacterium]
MRERDFGTLPVTGLLHVEQGEFYHEALDAMRTGEANFAALLIEGNPISEEELEKKMLAIARGLGEPFVDGGETDSFQSVQTIIPDPKMADEQVSSSSREELYLHSENAGMANMPDWVIIGCARNTEGAETTLVDPVRVFNGLSEENKQSLRQPVYYIQEPFSFTLAAGRRVRRRIRENIPVFDEQQSVRRPTVIADF